MKAATCALMVLVLHAVSNHRCVNGEISVATIEGFIEQGLDLVAKIQGLTSSDGVGNLLAQISDLSERIESIERNSMVQNQLNFDKLPQLLHTRTLMADHLRYLNKQLIGISRRYGDLKEFADGTTTYEDFTLIDFATNCVSPGDGVPRTLEKLNSLVIPEKDSFKNHDVLRRLADYLQETIGTQCSDKQSHQMTLYDLYKSIAIADIKGLALIQFSYMLLKHHGKGNFASELRLTQTSYEIEREETQDAFRKAMAIVSSDLWRCDPRQWMLGTPLWTRDNESYTQLYLHWNNNFNESNVIADIGSNKVVTGIRFIKGLNVVSFEIEQGELSPEGMIKANTTEWIGPMVYIVIGDPNAGEGEAYGWLPKAQKMEIKPNDIAAPPGHCLTGVRFTKRDSNLGLEIMTTPFDFATGRLIDPLTTSQWHGYDVTILKTALALTIPDKSTSSRLPPIANFGIDQYVMIRSVDRKMNAGRSMVPVINTRSSIRPTPRLAL